MSKKKEKASKSEGYSLDESNKTLREVNDVLESSGNDKLKELQGLDQTIDAANVIENPFTQYTFRSLKSSYEAFLLSNKNKLDNIDRQIKALAKTNISGSDEADIKDSFQHFDRDNDGKLNALDFYGVLKFLGEKVTEEDAANLLKQLGGSDGLLEYEEYRKWMVKKRADTDTKETYQSAFEQIAGGKHFLTADDLRRSGLSQEKVSYLTSHMPPYAGVEGGLDYKLWLNTTH